MISHRELRSLGIETSKRKRKQKNRSSSKILRTNLSAPAMNQSSDPFVEFSAKIQRVLECPDRDVVLCALRDLAEGKAASISGTVVDSLSGLRQQISGNVSNYREAMTMLLTWGIRKYLIEPSINAEHLWTSMSILDGPSGYNQKLFASGIFLESGIRVELQEGGLLAPSPPAPGIITKADQQPVKPFDVDVPYVVDYLKQEAGARAVVATSSGFGWEDLHVQCVCLYVDADTTQSLAESAAVQPTPTIILEGKLIHATTMEAATRLVEGPNLDKLKTSERKLVISERKSILRQNKSRRAIHNVGPFMHGQSISLRGAETKGSVAVFLSPEDEAEKRVYALTASHVVPSISATETQVITPGGLDILTRMLEVQPLPARHMELDFLLERWNNKCGEVRHRHIGTNGNDWRSDWALVCLENEWKGENGSWMNDEMTEFYIQINRGTPEETFTGSSGIISCADPMANTICYKDGATTGCTAGKVGPTRALIFRKGTAEAITEEEIQERRISPNEVDRATCVTVHPIGSERDVALPGDSGCGVFCPVVGEDGWSWVGQFVSIFYKKKGESVALMVPQSEILRSLREVTGKSWLLSVKNT